MDIAVCTLFEGSYHHGLVALVNSLVKNGFKGNVIAGYRGNLPDWAERSNVKRDFDRWHNVTVSTISPSVELYLVPLETDYHLTNYKPDFMLEILDGFGMDLQGVIYFDPDIVVTHNWSLFEQWLMDGVILCEDVNSPLLQNHPKRLAWRRYYRAYNIQLDFKTETYVNGGFVGVSVSDRSFLSLWKEIQQMMSDAIGGLNASKLKGKGKSLPKEAKGPFAPFSSTDQDALNVVVEAWEGGELSIVGKDAMGFADGRTVMLHALGSLKPWNYRPILEFISGIKPRQVDKIFWEYASGPLRSFSPLKIKYQLGMLKVVSFLARFYSK